MQNEKLKQKNWNILIFLTRIVETQITENIKYFQNDTLGAIFKLYIKMKLILRILKIYSFFFSGDCKVYAIELYGVRVIMNTKMVLWAPFLSL